MIPILLFSLIFNSAFLFSMEKNKEESAVTIQELHAQLNQLKQDIATLSNQISQKMVADVSMPLKQQIDELSIKLDETINMIDQETHIYGEGDIHTPLIRQIRVLELLKLNKSEFTLFQEKANKVFQALSDQYSTSSYLSYLIGHLALIGICLGIYHIARH